MNIETKFALQDKTVWILGAAGLIGSHLCDLLIERGAKVIGFDNFITGNSDNIAHLKDHLAFTFVKADITTYFQDLELLEAQMPDIVFHLASPASPPQYQRFPVETYSVNAFGTHSILSFLHSHAPDARLLFASTSEVYGDPLEHPQSESYWGNVNPNGIRSCYDESKRLGEAICGVFSRDKNMDVRICRIFNTYGPRLDPNDGRVVSNFISQALAGKKLTIYGDGAQTRSFCFVTDLVRALVIYASKDGLDGETINIGNPHERTVLDVARVVAGLVRPEVPFEEMVEYLPLPQNDPSRRKPDITKATSLLDWKPEVSFEDGLEQVIDSYRTLR